MSVWILVIVQHIHVLGTDIERHSNLQVYVDQTACMEMAGVLQEASMDDGSDAKMRCDKFEVIKEDSHGR